jgi:hypothetical protein
VRWRWWWAAVGLVGIVWVAALTMARPADPRDNLYYVDSAQILDDGVGEVSTLQWATPVVLGGGTRVHVTIAVDATRGTEQQVRRVSRNAALIGLPTDPACRRLGPGCLALIDAGQEGQIVVTTDFDGPRRT